MPGRLAWILALLIFTHIDAQYLFPTKSDIITGSFCEFRGNHLHTGIDISTNGVTGMPVIAPDDGWISYIKQDFLGYGKALFLANDSLTFVFGHLEGFAPFIEQKLDNRKYRQVLYPQKNSILVHKGDTIAYTGRSGTLYPHLHFETRSINNNPIDPMRFFSVRDTVYPEIASVLIEPADDSSLVCGRHDIVQIKCTKMNKSFYTMNPVQVHGAYKVSFEIIDRINSKTARLFVDDIAMFSGNREIFSMNIDSTSFSHSSSSPLMFRDELEIKNSYYMFHPHSEHQNWFFSSGAPVLYSDSDTIVGLSARDAGGNRTMLAFRVRDWDQNQNTGDYVKIKNIAGRINIIFSGSYAESLASVPEGFDFYSVSNVYKYAVYTEEKSMKAPFKLGNTNINYNIAYVSPEGHNMGKGIDIIGHSDYVMYNEDKMSIKGLKTYTPLYGIYYGDHYRKNHIGLVLSGFEGKSLYKYNGNHKYTFSGKLGACDTLYSHYLASFIIGIDTEEPSYALISKKKMKDYTLHKYKITDNVSGMDWDFVSDSNNVYNIPDPIMGTIEIRLPYDKSMDFILKDREGNRNIIHLK